MFLQIVTNVQHFFPMYLLKKLCVLSGPVQFKPTLFKGELYVTL